MGKRSASRAAKHDVAEGSESRSGEPMTMNDASCCVVSETTVPAAGLDLHLYIAQPTEPAWARLVIFHGYGDHAGRYLHFMRWMANRGVRCEAIDQRGHGRSPGRRGFVRKWDEFIDDARVLLGPRPPGGDAAPPLFVLGHSHGGLIAAAAGERGLLQDAGVAGVILASPYLATRLHAPAYKRLIAHVANRLAPWLRVRNGLQRGMITSDPEMSREDADDPLMHRSATPRWYITMRRVQAEVMQGAARFTLPVLCLVGKSDIVADPHAGEAFYRRCASADKSFAAYPDQVHELLREAGREAVFRDILAWLRARAARDIPGVRSANPNASETSDQKLA